MRIEGSIARTTATAFLIDAALYARGTRAQSGWIDGGYWVNGQFNISGWACDRGSSPPGMVMVIGPGSGGGIASAMANNPSEPAVGAACGAPWATNLRFNVAVGAATEEALIGRPVLVQAYSNLSRRCFRLGNWGAISYPDNAIRGYVDNAFDGRGQGGFSGWGCARGIAQSIWVHVYAGGPA